MNVFIQLFKPFIILLFIFFLPVTVSSQIQGSVKDVNNLPLPAASVLLLNQKDSSLVLGIMASEEGTFSISNFTPGNYLLGIKMLGYKPAYSDPFVIKSSNDHIHLDPIVAEEDVHQLQDVSVVAKKPIYELHVDRMVINVENSITSSGNTALDVLEKSPGVIVDRQNNSISMNGKSGVMVMINGRQNRMPIAAAVEMLASMNADNINKIELITSPPAKYDAEGNAGIINIVLKKHDDFGTNGSFNLGAGMGVHEKMNGSLELNHHVEKVNLFGLYNANFDNLQQNINSSRVINQSGSMLETNSESLREAQLLFQNARLGFDYTISSKTILGVLASGYIRDWNMDAVNDIYYRRDNEITSRSNLKTKELNKWVHYMGNINLQHHFKEEEILEFNFDYLNYDNNNPSNYGISNTGAGATPGSDEGIDVTKSTPIQIAVGTIDYSSQMSTKFKIEGGLKETATRFYNDVGVSYLRQGSWQIDNELTNNYRMKEDISALYSSITYSPNKKTSLIAGLRYEYMNSVLSSATEYGILDQHYGQLFPTFYFSRKLNDRNTWQFSYSRRIDRPTFNDLAPFVIFETPETFLSGNVKLVPAISNILKTDYQYKTIMFSISYTDTKNAIGQFQPKIIENENKQYLTARNLDHLNTISGIVAFPIELTKWWKMQNNFTWILQRLKTLYENQHIDITQHNYRINSIQNFTISKSISAEISGYYQSRSLQGVYVSEPIWSLDFGIQKKFNNDNSSLSLNATDVFNTNIYKSSANIPKLNINTKVLLDFGLREIRLTYTHKFGNTKVKPARKRKTGSEEERSRITN